MPKPLTQMERDVYHYLIDFLAENTYQPSIRDVAKHFRIKSTKSVSDLLRSLQAKGYIERDQSRSRGVRLLGFATSRDTQPVPYYGQVHAGEPALLAEHMQGYITVNRWFLPTEDVFFLRVKGDSMTGVCIAHGDYVLVSPSSVPKDGDIVAARLGNEATVKTLRHNGTTITLVPAKEGEHTIIVGPQDDFAILGVICGVFRAVFEKDEKRQGADVQ